MPVRPEEVSLTETYYRLTHIGALDLLVATGTDHRFDHDDEENPTSYLGDSVTTALKEVEEGLSVHPGFSTKIRPGDYRLITAQLRLMRVWDLRNPATKEALGPVAELITTQGHPGSIEEPRLRGETSRYPRISVGISERPRGSLLGRLFGKCERRKY